MPRRTAKSRPTGDGKVGYCRPPKSGQFQPGRSGNPRGRPKGRKNIGTILGDTLYRPVAITEKGRKRKVPAIEAMLLGLLRKSLDGDLRAFDKITKLMPLLQAASAAGTTPTGEAPGVDRATDAELLAEFAEMIRQGESLECLNRKEKDDEQ